MFTLEFHLFETQPKHFNRALREQTMKTTSISSEVHWFLLLPGGNLVGETRATPATVTAQAPLPVLLKEVVGRQWCQEPGKDFFWVPSFQTFKPMAWKICSKYFAVECEIDNLTSQKKKIKDS